MFSGWDIGHVNFHFFAALNVLFNIFTAVSKFGGPSTPHMLLSPQLSPLQPGAMSFPSKLSMNCPPCFALSWAKIKLSSTKPTGISTGKPISNFFSIGIDGIAKLNSPWTGLYFPFLLFSDVTWEKWPLPLNAFITPAPNMIQNLAEL